MSQSPVRPLSSFEPPLSPPVSGGPAPLLRTPPAEPEPVVAAPAPVVAAPAPAPLPEPVQPPKPSVEAMLLRFKLVTPDQMSDAMRDEALTHKSVPEIVVERGWVSQADLDKVIAHVNGEPEPTPAPVAAAPEPEPAPLPVAVPEPEPEPLPVAPAPIAAAPEPAPLAPPPAPTPMPAPAPPAPEPELPPAAAAPAPGTAFRVMVELDGGVKVEAGTFADHAGARAHAESLVEAVQRKDAWTFVAGKPLQPEKIRSIFLES